jgi:hypothetical protein
MTTPVIRLRYCRPLTPRHAWSVDPREIFTASIAFNLRWPGTLGKSLTTAGRSLRLLPFRG